VTYDPNLRCQSTACRAEASARRRVTRHVLHVGLGFAEAGDTVAVLPLAALFEKFGALEALQDIALAAKGGRRAQTAML